MFNLFTGNDAASLADRFGERLRAQVRGNPLVPARVLVPHAGLRRWLQVHLAEKFGVIANVDFRAPAEFVWELLRASQPESPHRSPFEPEVLRWHLHELLGESLEGGAFAPLREYLRDDGDGDPLRRFALAGELAHVFERMQGYRREKLLHWEHHELDRTGLNRGTDQDGWRAELWRRLVARGGGMSRAARVEKWLRDFDPAYPPGADIADKPAPPGLPSHVSAFACANISPDVLRMLGVAARHCTLDFFLPLLSREYLGDTPRSRREARARMREKDGGNPLIASLGGAAAEFVELLYGYEHVQPDIEYDEFDDGIAHDTLLGRVRDDLLNHVRARVEDREALPDDSLQFHACHTPLREAQTLHDALLAMLDADATLKPRDIAVMMPDVAAYRPAIEAVFGGLRENDPRFIPYNLGDVATGAAHPAVRLFLTLLDAPTSRWECSKILDVLAVPGVQRRLDLDASEVEQLVRQLKDSGVRWGEDERARAQVGGYREFSFAFGLDRMLAGFACGDDEDTLVAGVAPLAGVEGAAFARMDALLTVLAAYRQLRDWSSREAGAAEWQRRLNALFDGLHESDNNDIAESRALESLVEHTEAAAVRTLAWHDVRAFLRERLGEADPRQQLFSGGVTFCGMVPLRVVPFRVICLLGMDEAAFPRRDPPGLDPLTADRRAKRNLPGDRSVREDDRLLFLQLLAAARDAFYVSWVGRDARSNETLAPSMVVAELMDVLREDYLAQPADEDAKTARDKLLPRVQPLHPFDASLFGAKGRDPVSYRGEWLPAARTTVRPVPTVAPFVRGELSGNAREEAVTLDALHRFFDNPARGYLERALQLRLPRNAEEDADLEPLRPDQPLLRHRLTEILLHDDGSGGDEMRRLLQARGELPPGALADAAIAIARERAEPLRAAIAAFTGGAASLPEETRSLELGDVRLTGIVRGRYPAGLLRATPGKLNGKRVLRAWLDLLFAAATGTPSTCRLIAFDKEAQSWDLLAPDDACGELQRWMDAYRRGLREPLPLFPQASWKALKRTRVQKGPATFEEFIACLRDEAAGVEGDNGFRMASDFDDAAVRLVWRGRQLSTFNETFARDLFDTASGLFPLPTAVKTERRS